MKLFENKSVLKIWLLSYVVMIMIVIFTNIYMISGIRSELRLELETTNKYFLRNVNLQLDSFFSDAQTLKGDIEKNGVAQDFAKASVLDEKNRFEAAKVIDELTKTENTNDRFLGLICYFPKTDLIITPKGFSQSAEYYTNNLDNSGDGCGEWTAELSQCRFPGITSRVLKTMYGEEHNVIELTYPVFDSSEELSFIIRIYIDKNSIFDVARRENDILLITDSRNNTLVTSDDKSYDFSETLFDKEYAIRVWKHDGEKSYVSCFNSFKHKYHYIYITDSNYFTENFKKVVLTGVFISVLCIVLLAVIMLITGRWNYSKIKNVIAGFDDTMPEGNEYNYIKQKISLMQENAKSMQERMENQGQIIRNNFLTNYMLGFTDYKNISEKLADYAIVFKYDYYFVITICVSDDGILNDLPRKDILFVLNNVMEDIADTEHMQRAEAEGMLSYIVNCPTDARKEQQKSIDALKRLSDLMGNLFEISVFSGVSNIEKGFENVPKLYREAAAALENADFYELDSAVCYDDIEQIYSKNDYESFIQRENELMAAVSRSDVDEARRITEELFSASGNNRNQWYYESIMYSILNNILAGKLSADDSGKIMSLAENIGKNPTIKSMKAVIMQTVEIVCSNAKEENNRAKDIYMRVRSFVEENYSDTNLNISGIGDKFGMSAFYISHIFKENSGVKLGSFINELRVGRAKELLAGAEEMKINDIAQMSGFDNIRTFQRIFKNVVGCSPSEYRLIKNR